MPKHRILIVDDHPLFRAGLRRLLEQGETLTVVAEASTAHEVIQQLYAHAVDLVLMDVQLPGVTGLQVVPVVTRHWPKTKVAFLSMHADDERRFAALQAGAVGFLTKDAEPAEVLRAVHALLRGDNLLLVDVIRQPALAGRLIEALRTLSDAERPPAGAGIELTPRELEVLDCLVMGRTNRETGLALFLTEPTVKNHVTTVLRKLQATDRLAALRFAVSHGWTELGRPNDTPLVAVNAA